MNIYRGIKKFWDSCKERCDRCKVNPPHARWARYCEPCEDIVIAEHIEKERKQKRAEEIRLAKLNAKYIAAAIKKR